MLFTFRNRKHYDLMFKGYASKLPTWVKTTSVYRKDGFPDDGTRPYTKCAMNSQSTSSSDGGKSRCAKEWTTSDGGDWWLKDDPYSEPNGDAIEGSYISIGQWTADGIGWINDGRSRQYTGNVYFCMPRKD
jgi:hypothetical protein